MAFFLKCNTWQFFMESYSRTSPKENLKKKNNFVGFFTKSPKRFKNLPKNFRIFHFLHSVKIN